MAKGRGTSTVSTLLPPTGGWNTRDPLPSMPPEDAISLDNMVPGVGNVSLRKGFSSWKTGLGSFVESLMVYSAVTGSEKMFAATPTAVYDVSASGAVGAADISSLTNGRWQHAMFGAGGGNYLVMFNGADNGKTYDGSSWADISITGVASTSIIGVTPHAGRLWLIEKNTLNVWYLDVSAISGAATKFPLSQFCKLGGYLMAVGSWSVDGGAGLNDNIAFVTSNGEVVIYQGSDPSSSTTWALVGVFRIAEPIGRRCLIKAGADLAIMTSIGLTPLSRVLSLNISAQESVTFSNKISPTFANSFKTAGTAHGWAVTEYPRANLIICNIPIAERVTQHQYIANTVTGAWARWKDINAGCWALFGTDMYFGGNGGTVYRFDIGHQDDGSSVSFLVQQAFSNFGTHKTKRFIAARPLVVGPATYTPSVQMLLDYDSSLVSLPAIVEATGEPMWDVAMWDVVDWDVTSTPVARWQGITGLGQVGSLAIKDTMAQEFIINQTDIVFETGNYL